MHALLRAHCAVLCKLPHFQAPESAPEVPSPVVCFVCCALLVFAYRRLHHEFLMVRGDGSWEGAEFIIETR